MPIFADRESLASVRTKINDAIVAAETSAINIVVATDAATAAAIAANASAVSADAAAASSAAAVAAANAVAASIAPLSVTALVEGKARALWYETVNIAPTITGATYDIVLPKLPANNHRPYRMIVSLREPADASRAWYASFPFLLHKGTAASATNLTFGAISDEIAFAGGPGYITINGVGQFNLGFSAVTSSATTETFTMTPTNNSATRTHKMFFEIL